MSESEGMALSAYGEKSSRPSPAARMMAAFSEGFRDGVDINLGVGYVNEDTIPVQLIAEATERIADHPQQFRQAFNYGGPEGAASLHAAIRNFLLSREGSGWTQEKLQDQTIAIGASGATSILEGLARILPVGIVVTSDPHYYIYGEQLRRLGFKVLSVKEGPDGLDPDEVERKIFDAEFPLDQLSFFYLVPVSNPGATVMTNHKRRRWLKLAQRVKLQLKRSVPLIFDEAYSLLIHDQTMEPVQSVLPRDEQGVAYEVGTLSKVFSPALRIGYLLGPEGPLMQAMNQHTADVGFSAPLLNQEIATLLLREAIDEQLERVNEGYRQKAALMKQCIEDKLSPWLESVAGGSAGFYFYLTFKSMRTDRGSLLYRFCTRQTGNPDIDGSVDALNPRLVYIPGAICMNPEGDHLDLGLRQLRLSYGFEDIERLGAAVDLLAEGLSYAEQTIERMLNRSNYPTG